MLFLFVCFSFVLRAEPWTQGFILFLKSNVLSFFKWVVEFWILQGVWCTACAFNAFNAMEFLKDFHNSDSHYLWQVFQRSRWKVIGIYHYHISPQLWQVGGYCWGFKLFPKIRFIEVLSLSVQLNWPILSAQFGEFWQVRTAIQASPVTWYGTFWGSDASVALLHSYSFLFLTPFSWLFFQSSKLDMCLF